VLQVASLDDLMANKVKVILQRVSAKDYIDIAAMLSAGVALDRGLAAAREMFGNAFQPSESLRAMTYFQGGDLYLLTADVKETLIRAASAVRELPKIQVLSHSLAGHQAELDVSLEEDRPEGNSPDISI
jgi:Nucleotidyl transferase AbiEii toxin, Type IV TA system